MGPSARSAAIAALSAVAFAVAVGVGWIARDHDGADQRELPRARPVVPAHPAAPPATLTGSRSLSASAPAPARRDGDVVDTPNLFATFQLGIGSNDPTVLAAALNAWRTCAGYTGAGTWDLDTWLDVAMPPGLPIVERDRRAQHALAAAAKCAGFALQTDAQHQAAEMTKKALDLGVTSERLRQAFRDHVQSNGQSPETTALSCAVVSE